ncbi:hypothetical protein ACFQ09_20990 [Massilia norwichensis]|uniref:Uncharacterized protein n=1 Tax=Massilia norwichensis TaxID=1442366 RepID=A0ABT2A8L8_9BURK|nr:hypothetical protein [Massilia norwichensis]MCS0590145.1 hypothetical protein [Massilia norwichensis]
MQLKDIGRFDNVSLTAVPGGAANCTLSSNALNANGCGGGAHIGSGLCFSGQHDALSDFSSLLGGLALLGATARRRQPKRQSQLGFPPSRERRSKKIRPARLPGQGVFTS